MDKQPFTDQDLKGWAKFFVIVGAGLLLLYFIVPEDDRACILFFGVCYGVIFLSFLCALIGCGVISDESMPGLPATLLSERCAAAGGR